MTSEGEHEPPIDESESVPDEALEDDAIGKLLRGAAKKAESEAPPPAALLPAVQKKLRERSRGKFYGDGWSTAQQTTSYLLVSLLMLIVLGAAFYALGPSGVVH